MAGGTLPPLGKSAGRVGTPASPTPLAKGGEPETEAAADGCGCSARADQNALVRVDITQVIFTGEPAATGLHMDHSAVVV